MRPKKGSTVRQGNYAFIDSQNLNLGTQKMGWKMDWRRFRQYLKAKHNVTKAFMFIGYMPENEDLYTLMHEFGYLVVLKPTLEMYKTPDEPSQNGEDHKPSENHTDDKKPATKGNVDAELVLWAVKEMPKYQKAIIVSGDGDFYSLVEHLKDQNKLLHLMTPNRMYSTLLKPFESYIIRLDQMRRQLEYKNHKRSSEQKSSR